MHAIRIVSHYNGSVSRYINELIVNNVNDREEALRVLKLDITNATSNRLTFYKLINPDLIVHDLDTLKQDLIDSGR